MMHYVSRKLTCLFQTAVMEFKLTANLPLDNVDISGIHYFWDLQNVYLYYY